MFLTWGGGMLWCRYMDKKLNSKSSQILLTFPPFAIIIVIIDFPSSRDLLWLRLYIEIVWNLERFKSMLLVVIRVYLWSMSQSWQWDLKRTYFCRSFNVFMTCNDCFLLEFVGRFWFLCGFCYFLAVKLNAGRNVIGVLRGFDQFMNLVLDNTTEINGAERTEIGMVVWKFFHLNPVQFLAVFLFFSLPLFPLPVKHEVRWTKMIRWVGSITRSTRSIRLISC